MNTDQAFEILKEAGVSDSISIQIVRRWLRQGKIKYEGNVKRKTRRIIDETSSKPVTNHIDQDQDKDELIRQLKLKIKAKDEHIEGIEELHESATKISYLQRDQLNKEIAILKNEKRILQNETNDLLKENIELRNQLIKLKEKMVNGNTSNNENLHFTPQSIDYFKKLGLSKMASRKEIVAGYKELLKLTHPDHGGNAKAFQYIKTDYDQYKTRFKE